MDKVDSIIANTSAKMKDTLMKGPVGVWISSRRNKCFYMLNKILSISVAVFFALVTLGFKRTSLVYEKQSDLIPGNADMEKESFHIRTIYWFMFIYFSLAAMDEMIELFSVIMQLEKGALGLFFELNYMIGMYLTGHIVWFVNTYTVIPTYDEKLMLKKSSQTHYSHMYNWIYFQYIYMFFSIFMMMLITCMYKKMNNQAKAMLPSHDHHDENESETKGDAIN